MEDGKGARKSNDITATPIREARTTSKKQQSERKQELANKLRSAMKKNLTAYFGKGKRSPGPTTAGNPIKTVIQCCELQRGTPTGKGDSGAGVEGKKDDNNGWHTPLVKKKRDKSNVTPPQGAEGKEGQNNRKPRSDNEESAGEQSKGTEQAGHTVDLESMSASMRQKSPKTKIPKSKKSKEKQEDSAKKLNQTPRKKATFALEESEESGKKKEEEEVAVNPTVS